MITLVNAQHARRAGSAAVALTAAWLPISVAVGAADRAFDATAQSPGAAHRIRVTDLPPPFATPSADNRPQVIARPKDAWPRVPAGFRVRLYATGLTNPRLLRTAPNGDVLVVDSRPGAVILLRGLRADGTAERVTTFATGLRKPFGAAFFPPGGKPEWLYVANTDSVVRFPYRSGDLRAGGAPQTVVAELPGGGLLRGGGHWTRDLAFSLDGKKMYVSVGSRSNVDDTDGNAAEHDRAAILEFAPDGSGRRVYAWGIRNPVGIAVSPLTRALWTSVNERDELGDDLVPDYITRVEPGGFYGWPWFYLGGNQDPRHRGKHPELRELVAMPDVLLPPHSASLQLTFYEGAQFPPIYRGDIFAAQHGSWNRQFRTGYQVVRVPMDKSGRARGGYEDFLTGFVTPQGQVWGRPVGVTVAADGALLVSDDGGGCVWRVEATSDRR